MTPAEVREVLKRMWQRNTDILSLLYAVENKNVPHSNKIHTKYEDIYEMFFVQTVPVAPNKFRAPSKLGDQVFEHPQNTLLVTIINANLDLVSLSDKAVTDPANENEVCCKTPLFAFCGIFHGLRDQARLY
jgi:DNA-directed RNA polymerase I subunit RPA1